MPVGDYDKPHIRQIAEEIGLPVATKHDSQDICFVPDHDYASFITQETGKESKPGNFVDEEGNIMGQHRGLIHYTIGQRKGLGISSSTPIFVKELRPQTNEVVLCKSESLFSRDCHVDNINYMAEEKLTGPVKAIGKIRYSHAGAPCTLYPQPDGTLLAQSSRFATGILYTDLDVLKISSERRRMGTFANKNSWRDHDFVSLLFYMISIFVLPS